MDLSIFLRVPRHHPPLHLLAGRKWIILRLIAFLSNFAEMADIFGLPKKAIGKWAVVAEDDVERRLMKVRLDGYFADDKYNNHQRISNRIWGQMFGGVRCAKFEFSKLCTRKKNWILALIDEFEKIPELAVSLRKFSLDDIVLQIIDDTNSERPQGKAYSSIASAITYWKYKYGDNER